MSYGATSPTISSAGVNAILNALQQMGLDIEVIKKEAGLDDIDLDDNELRLSCQYATDCYRIGQKYWDADDFGLQHGLKYQPFTLGIVGHLLTTAQTGLEALNSYEQYQSAFGEGLKFTVVEEPVSESGSENVSDTLLVCSLSVHPDMQSKVDAALIDSFFVAFVNCIKLLTGELAPLMRVDLQRGHSHLSEKYAQFFACPVVYSASSDRVLLPKSVLEKPLLTANPMLFQVLKNQSDSILKGLSEKDILAKNVRSEILKCIDGSKIDIKRVASRLAMSERTLQRQLQADGDTFQGLLDEVRAEFSKQQLQKNSLSIEDLSYLLAYSEPSIFRKTFKRWTGTTPSEYRKQHSALSS